MLFRSLEHRPVTAEVAGSSPVSPVQFHPFLRRFSTVNAAPSDSSAVRVRLAPSPTGTLHIGTARTAVFNWLFARRHGGQFLLRIEDTDKERSQQAYTDNILEGLQWLGLHWDGEPVVQSTRIAEHRAAIQQLLDSGHAYRCYASEDELTAMREQQAASKQAPRYDNRHRHLSHEQEAAYIAEGRQATVRFRIDDGATITWRDLVRGEIGRAHV